MTKVRQYLNTRREELDSKLTPIARRRDELREELEKVDAVANEIILELTEVDTALSALATADEEAETKAKLKLTIKGAVLSVLKMHPEGLTSGEILTKINTRYFDGTIKRESLSPQLTRLKRDDKKIDLIGDRWYRLPHNEAMLFAPKS